MSKVSEEVGKILKWCDNKPIKEGWLIAKADMAPSSFTQMKNGFYKPGKRTIKDCFLAIEEYERLQALESTRGGKKTAVT